MKLKYFLRGLGSGIVITAIILTVSFQGRSSDISEKEIIKRAEALGMVSKEKADLLAENNENTDEGEVTVTEEAESTTMEETEEAEPTTAEETEEATVTPEETEEAEPTTTEETEEATATSEPTEKPTATPEPTEKPTATPEPTKEPTATPEPTVEPTQPSTEKKVITIVSGMWSDKVARELEAMGVIEDATDFDQYLIANGYANRIVVGTFEIPAGATYEQIAQIITTR